MLKNKVFKGVALLLVVFSGVVFASTKYPNTKTRV